MVLGGCASRDIVHHVMIYLLHNKPMPMIIVNWLWQLFLKEKYHSSYYLAIVVYTSSLQHEGPCFLMIIISLPL